jgi:site-specific recombinase XerD
LAQRVSQETLLPLPTTNLSLIDSLPLDQNPAAVYLARLKKSSRRPQKSALDTVAGILSGGRLDCFNLDWSRVRYQHTALVRSQLLDGYAPNTANRILCALRGTLQQAWLLGHMSAEDYHRAAHISPIIGERLPAGRELSHDEISKLMLDCINDSRHLGTRDAAIIAVMYAGGLRREEVTKLDMVDSDLANAKLVVHGKRSKDRAVYLTEGAVEALKAWIRVRGKEAGPIFVHINKGNNLIEGKRMTTQAIYYLLKSRARHAGVDRFSPHDMRRTFISDLLEAGVDIATVARMAGHSSVDTTARYDRRPEQAKQRAALLLKIQYG